MYKFSIIFVVIGVAQLSVAQYNYPSPSSPLSTPGNVPSDQSNVPGSIAPGFNPQSTVGYGISPTGSSVGSFVQQQPNQLYGQPSIQGAPSFGGQSQYNPSISGVQSTFGNQPGVGIFNQQGISSQIGSSSLPGAGGKPSYVGSTLPGVIGSQSSFPSTSSGIASQSGFGSIRPGGSNIGGIGSTGSSFPANGGSFIATGSGSSSGNFGGIGNGIGNGIGSGTPGAALSGSSSGNDDGSYQNGDYSAIPGRPEIDYPILTEIPQTSFDCKSLQWPGYYADVEARCQVFHICALNKTFDFLCPNGTIFSQEHLVCVWWNQFDCNSAPSLYEKNALIYDYSKTGSQSSSGSLGGSVVDAGSQNGFGAGSQLSSGSGSLNLGGSQTPIRPATNFGVTGASSGNFGSSSQGNAFGSTAGTGSSFGSTQGTSFGGFGSSKPATSSGTFGPTSSTFGSQLGGIGSGPSTGYAPSGIPNAFGSSQGGSSVFGTAATGASFGGPSSPANIPAQSYGTPFSPTPSPNLGQYPYTPTPYPIGSVTGSGQTPFPILQSTVGGGYPSAGAPGASVSEKPNREYLPSRRT